MKKDTLKKNIASIIGIAIIFAICVLSGILFLSTKYFLYYFFFITALFLGATNTLFIVLKFIEKERSKPKEEKEKKKKWKIQIKYSFWAKVLSYGVYVWIFYLCSTKSWSYVKTIQNTGKPAAVHGVVALIMFVCLIIFDRVCKYQDKKGPFTDAILENNRIFYKLLCFQTLFGVAYVIYESLDFYNVQKYVGYVYVASLYYFMVFMTLSLVVVAIRKEFAIAPYLNVPIPLWKSKGSQERMGFVEYLETNTGISMRSLWSVKYIRQIAPMVVFLSGIFLWLSTCIVQVDTYQQAAVYRLGGLQDKVLKPGIHLTLPYPLDKVEIYDTETVQKTTIGYRATENEDNIWTKGHGNEEYKLLLGGGDELVSINLRLEYKIQDLNKYLKTTTKPVAHMEALAYELVTDKTIETDLNTLLSTDRDAFAIEFKKELSQLIKERNIGLEVVSVVLESVHPPVEIADAYQKLIGAEISAEKYILYAQGDANAKIAKAEKTAYAEVSLQQVEYEEKLAEAKASVAEFLASAEAYKEHKDAYTYQKYLSAVRQAYGKANLVILGEGVDESILYFGSLSGITKAE